MHWNTTNSCELCEWSRSQPKIYINNTWCIWYWIELQKGAFKCMKKKNCMKMHEMYNVQQNSKIIIKKKWTKLKQRRHESVRFIPFRLTANGTVYVLKLLSAQKRETKTFDEKRKRSFKFDENERLNEHSETMKKNSASARKRNWNENKNLINSYTISVWFKGRKKKRKEKENPNQHVLFNANSAKHVIYGMLTVLCSVLT